MHTKMEKADALLEDWYKWTQDWRPPLGHPSSVPYCREGLPEGDWCSGEEQDGTGTSRTVLETIDNCINSLPPEIERAIGLEMRRRRNALREWKGGCQDIGYKKALMALLPKLAQRCLI